MKVKMTMYTWLVSGENYWAPSKLDAIRAIRELNPGRSVYDEDVVDAWA